MASTNIAFMKVVAGTSMSTAISELSDQLGQRISIVDNLKWELSVNDAVSSEVVDLDVYNGVLKVAVGSPFMREGIFPCSINCYRLDADKTFITRAACYISSEPDFGKVGSHLVVTVDKLSRALSDIDFESNETIGEKEFDDALLCESYIRAVDTANALTVGKDSSFIYNTKEAPEVFTMGATAYALETISANISRNRIRAGEGIPDIDERVDTYMQLSNMYMQQFKNDVRKIKQHNSYKKYLGR